MIPEIVNSIRVRLVVVEIGFSSDQFGAGSVLSDEPNLPTEVHMLRQLAVIVIATQLAVGCAVVPLATRSRSPAVDRRQPLRVAGHDGQGVRMLQGEVELDEEDFFRIAGDAVSLVQVRSERSNAVYGNAVGLSLMGSGVLSVITSFFVGGGAEQAVLVGIGAGSVAGGWLVADHYADKFAPDYRVLGPDNARRAAESYNRRLVLGVSGRF